MEIIRRSGHDHPRTLDTRLRRGSLRSLYPGVLAPSDQPITLEGLLGAARLIDPDAVVTGEGARLLGWAGIVPPAMDRSPIPGLAGPLELATKLRLRGSSEYLRFSRRTIPLDFVAERGAVRFTTPELTAVDLIPRHGAGVVDEVLRLAGARSEESLHLMRAALATLPNRHGNPERERVLHASRGRPWSEAERQLHALLRSWGYGDWEANYRVVAGRVWFLDVAFVEQRVALEFDSRQFHSSADAFENDRLKANELRSIGWLVYQLTWKMLQAPEQIRRWLRRALK